MEGEEPSVGIDVSKSVLDVSLYPSGNTWQVEYSPPCVTGLAEELADLGPTAVVVEATGGLEMSLTAVLGETGGRRGSMQTSPDLGLLVNQGRGLVLVEKQAGGEIL